VSRQNTVCVIIPTYNRPHLVVETVKSVVAQTRRPDRIIVADDGGDAEATARALHRFRDRIEQTWGPNAGKSAVLNRTIADIGEDMIWIVDDDDLVSPDALEKLEAALLDHPEAMFSYGLNDDLVRQGDQWVIRPRKLPSPDQKDLKLTVLERCFLLQPGMLVRSAAYERIGQFDTALPRSQDYDMLLKLTRHFKGVQVEGIVFHQRFHDGDRGPASSRFAADKRHANWAETDKRIFTRIHETYKLAEYLPGEPENLSREQTAQALINRSVVMARKGLWALAVGDLQALPPFLTGGPDLDLAPFSRLFESNANGLPDGKKVEPFLSALRALPEPYRREALRRLTGTLPGWAFSALKKRRWDRLGPAVSIMMSAGPGAVIAGYRDRAARQSA